MTEADYPAARVEESGTPCIALARLPALPVRVLVLGPGAAGARPLAPRLTQLAEDLGAGDGVAVVQAPLASWREPFAAVSGQRFDVVILRPEIVPASEEESGAAPAWLVESVAAGLAMCSTRVWMIEPPAPERPVGGALRLDLSRRVVRSGGPPVVVLPPEWEQLDPPGFLAACLEHLLHDAPLETAVQRASDDRRPAALMLVPQGRRHGLDLARLLEDHRMRIGEQTSGLRSFQREYEAFRAAAGDHPAFDPLGERLAARAEALAQVKDACDEINRDRDPAGWSRLALNMARLQAIEAEEDGDRAALRATAARVAEQGG